jgi:DNA-binding transcriptional MerR regulator
MAKLKLYERGGVLYYKSGGKMCKYEGSLKKYQMGDNVDDDANSIKAIQNSLRDAKVMDAKEMDNKQEKTPKGDWKDTASSLANMGSTLFNTVRDSQKSNQPVQKNKYRDYAFRQDKKWTNEQAQGKSVANSVIGAIPKWGQFISSMVNLGTSASNAIKNDDSEGVAQSEAQEVIGNIMSPSEKLLGAIRTGGKYGVGAGFADFFTFGAYGHRKDKEVQGMADKEYDWKKQRQAKFDTLGNNNMTRNDTIYAKYGQEITTQPVNKLRDNWNAEIEDGEIAIANKPGDIDSMTFGGLANMTLNESPYAVEFTGDKHGQDTDGDGQQGIPIKANTGMYIASNYLGVDGKVAGPGKKTVAQEMKPIVESLADAHKNSQDMYKNNPQLIKHQLGLLNSIKQESEQGKALEGLRKLLNKKDRNMDEIAAYIQANPGLIAPQTNQTQSLPKMQGLPMAQSGGKLVTPPPTKMKDDMEYYATKKGVPLDMVEQARPDDPANYNNFDETFKGQSGDYKVDFNYTDEDIPYDPDDITEDDIKIMDTINLGTESKQGGKENIRTLEQQAGKSEWTGISKLVQEKLRELVDENIFDGTGHFSDKWIDVISKKYGAPREELANTTMDQIDQPGPVRDAIGQLLKDAYGTREKGKDEPAQGLDANVRGDSGLNKIENDLAWVDDIISKVSKNNNILPSQYNWLPEDLKNSIIDAARSGKRGWEQSYGPSLKRAYNKTLSDNTQEVSREGSLSFDESEAKGNKPDETYDLYREGIDGKKLTFNEAFRYARKNGLPTFTWNGRLYAARTGSEDPELKAASMKSSYSKPAKQQLTITPQTLNKDVVNPKRELKAMKYGGKLPIYQQKGTITDPIRNVGGTNTYQTANADAIKFIQSLEGKPDLEIKAQLENQSIPREQRAFALDYFIKKKNAENQAARLNSQSQSQATQDYLDQYSPYIEAYKKELERQKQGKGGIDVRPKNDDITKYGYNPQPYQMGGQMEQPMPNESNAHMNQLMGQEQQPMEPAPDPMGTGNVDPNVNPALAELSPQMQQLFMSLPPEQQEQLLKLPADQLAIALEMIAGQMGQGAGAQMQAPQPQQPMMKNGGNMKQMLANLWND